MNADELFEEISKLPQHHKIDAFCFLYGMMSLNIEAWQIKKMEKFIKAVAAKGEK